MILIIGVVNVAGGFNVADQGAIGGLIGYLDMLNSTFKVAQEWKIKRLTFSSTGGLYIGSPGQAK